MIISGDETVTFLKKSAGFGNPTTQETKTGRRQKVQNLSGIQNKFKATPGNLARSCLLIKKPKGELAVEGLPGMRKALGGISSIK